MNLRSLSTALSAALSIGLVAAALAGCTTGPGPTPHASGPADVVAPSSRSTVPTAACRVFPPRWLSQSLHRQWARPRPGRIIPFESTARGPWIAAQVSSDGFRGVALVNLETDQVQHLDRFGDPTAWVGDGAYDGSAAIWVENHSEYGGDFVIKAWDVWSGVVRVVSRWDDDPSTRPGTATASAPTVAHGYAAWTEGVGRRRARVVLLDLRTGVKTVVATGHPTAPLIHAGDLVWREAASPDGPFRTYATSLRDLSPVTPPAALAARPQSLVAATDGRAIAWIELRNGKDEVFYSADGVAPGRLLLRTRAGGFALVVRRGVVVTGYSDGMIAVNADGVSATLTLGGGGAYGVRNGFVVAPPNLEKSTAWPPGLAVVAARRLRALSCS